ncbi:MAG: NDP-sugar synthase [Patescibacteria group bacterium]|nr:NDP-sugar synthase [Patescibacteria group bacterium]
MIKQAVISAGGFGTRLRPITDTIPKPMIPILGKPLLQWHIDQFRKAGVTEFFFALQYLPNVIRNYFKNGSGFGVKINYHVEEAPLGTAGCIKPFEKQLDGDFFYIYGDTFSLIDYAKMEAYWRSKPDAAAMERIGNPGTHTDSDTVETDQEMRFLKIYGKHSGQNHPGAYRQRGSFIFKKKVLSYIPSDAPSQVGTELLPALIAAGESCYGYLCDDYSKGIDTMEKWKEVEEYLRKQNRLE